ncbi:MAG TPA: dihydroorotase [Acidimicrobiales bacterium]|nr:dihydroorotase [Acidimicrobiales bacterium]
MAEIELVVRGGLVIGADGTRRADVAVAGGVVVATGPDLDVPVGATVLDAGGCLVGPGLVDLHTHLRQPGREEAETVESGARAAALGGYTAVLAMPNTDPAIDSAGTAREVLALGRSAVAEVAVAGAITVGRSGERLAPMAELAALGIGIFTDDGAGVQDGALMRRALEYARGLGVTLAQHCEDESLAAGGAMHEGAWSSRLGLPGIPAAAEEAMVARDIALVRLTGALMHFLHLSTAGSLELVRRAKAEGVAVTAEAAPHHFFLTDAEVATYDPVYKVNPPLRPLADVRAVRRALCDGTVDAIATDHAPHAPETKDLPFDQAPPGMLGLETALALAFTALGGSHAGPHAGPHAGTGGGKPRSSMLRDGAGPDGAGEGQWRLSPERIFGLLSRQPAAIARLGPDDRRLGGHSAHGGPVEPGAAANLCIFDPLVRWTVDPRDLASRSRNTPYEGRELVGRVRHTVLRGEPVVVDAVAQR